MMAYKKPQQRTKEESEKLRGEGDKIKYIDLRFERWQVAGFNQSKQLKCFNTIIQTP